MSEITQNLSEDKGLFPEVKQVTEEHAPVITFPIAGFFQRILAITVDGLIVSIPLLIFAALFKNLGYALGPYGRIVGYTIMTVYWTLYNSRLHNGQTPGKKLFKIAVVDKQGNPLTLRSSFFRAAILAIIAILNGWAVPILQNPIAAFLVTIIVFGGGLSLVYGLIFNRTTRQGIHDLIMNTYVVCQTSSITEAVPPELPKVHQWVISGIIGVSVLVAIVGLVFQLVPFGKSEGVNVELDEIQQLQTMLVQQDDILTATVTRVNRTSVTTGTMLRDLNIEVWVKTPCQNNESYCDALLKEIAQMVFTEYNDISALDGMKISVVNRVDFGIATSNRVQGSQLRIEDWQEYINK